MIFNRRFDQATYGVSTWMVVLIQEEVLDTCGTTQSNALTCGIQVACAFTSNRAAADGTGVSRNEIVEHARIIDDPVGSCCAAAGERCAFLEHLVRRHRDSKRCTA